MAIALSPAGARSIIASGRIAVFIGCESAFDHEGDTRPRRGPAFPR
jgi:membrane dipeptidase